MGLFFFLNTFSLFCFFLSSSNQKYLMESNFNYSTKWSWRVVDNNIPAMITICSGANPARVAGKWLAKDIQRFSSHSELIFIFLHYNMSRI